MTTHMETFYHYPEIVRKGVCNAARRLHAPVTDRDLDDMLQEGQARVWIYARDKPEAYQYVTARTAAWAWYFRFYLEKRKPLNSKEFVPRHLSLEELETEAGDLNLVAPAPPNPEGRPLPISGNDLVELLASTRRGYHTSYHSKSIGAARKDARIVELLAQGYTNFGIARELGMSADQVRFRRSSIRRALQGILDDVVRDSSHVHLTPGE